MIVIDVREKPKVKQYFKDRLSPHADVVEAELDVGDFAVTNGEEGYIIERKSLHDFVNSIKNRRIFNQAKRLVEATRDSRFTPLIIVEGAISGIPKFSDISLASVHGAIASLYDDYGIEVLFVPSRFHTALHLMTLEGRLTKKRVERVNLPMAKPPKGNLDEVRVAIVSLLPFIGVKRAKELLGKHRSLYEIFQLDVSDFERIKGITHKRARLIVDFIRGEWKSYE